jgi:hypothetical protein
MIVESDGYRFDFTDAVDAFKFDETSTASQHFHGGFMKAVDVIAEFPNAYVFIELKEFTNIGRYNILSAAKTKWEVDNFREMKQALTYKYRDTCLYRYSEDLFNKQVHYICLLNFDNALNLEMKAQLAKDLPVGLASVRWVRPIAQSCQVLNLTTWNRIFPKWPVRKVTTP